MQESSEGLIFLNIRDNLLRISVSLHLCQNNAETLSVSVWYKKFKSFKRTSFFLSRKLFSDHKLLSSRQVN